MSRLLHYSAKPISRIRSARQLPLASGGRYDKPMGLWVSVEGEDDWRSWCEAEDFGNPSAQLCYEIRLADDAKILRLSDEGELRAFTEAHAFDPYMGPMAGRTVMSGYGIRWDEIAKAYQGIIIAPYIWECRLAHDTNWYYGWDCASGCIWDAHAIAEFTLCAPAAPSQETDR